MQSSNVIFESGSESITDSENYRIVPRDNYYLYFTSNSVYLREKFYMALEDYFNHLKYLWLEESKFSSNVYFLTKHPAYLNILKLGKDVIPLILEDLSEFQNHWFYALRELTGENPIKPEHNGNIKEMAKDWIEWGKKMNYIQ